MGKNKEVKLLCGIPASGKSTWGKKFVANNVAKWVRICRDDYRYMMKNVGWCDFDVEKMISKLVNDTIVTSAIEKPKSSSELLDFKAKYLSGSKTKLGGTKTPGTLSQGMLSLTREINPQLDTKLETDIRAWATQAFTTVNGSGAPRIDFLCNSETHECWLNEINPCPGSLGYFLWEAADKPVLFTELLTSLIEEAFAIHTETQLPNNPVPEKAQLLSR